MLKLYVGNLSYGTTEKSLETAFAAYGKVRSVTLVQDRQTGKSRGFGFVEMDDPQEAASALGAMNGKQVDGRTLTVNEARPRTDRAGESGGRGEGRGQSQRW